MFRKSSIDKIYRKRSSVESRLHHVTQIPAGFYIWSSFPWIVDLLKETICDYRSPSGGIYEEAFN